MEKVVLKVVVAGGTGFGQCEVGTNSIRTSHWHKPVPPHKSVGQLSAPRTDLE